MSLRTYFPTEFACEDVFDRKEDEVLEIDETSWDWESYKGRNIMDSHQQYHHVNVNANANANANTNTNAIEFDIDFWPIEHPMEPPDEDRPVKCPMSASSSSSINEGQGHEERVAAGESSRKRSEVPEMVKEGRRKATEPTVRAVRKRHHTLIRDDHIILKPLVRMPPLPPQNLTIFQMLQEFDEP